MILNKLREIVQIVRLWSIPGMATAAPVIKQRSRRGLILCTKNFNIYMHYDYIWDNHYHFTCEAQCVPMQKGNVSQRN